MDTLSIVLVIIAVIFISKGVVGALSAGIEQARNRLARSDTDVPITEPASHFGNLRRRIPTESSIYGVLGFAAVAFLIGRLFFTSKPEPTPAPSQTATARPGTIPGQVARGPVSTISPEELALSQDASVAATAVSTDRMAYSLGKLKQRQVLDLGERLKTSVSETKALMDGVDDLVTRLQTSDDGKGIACEPRLVSAYLAVLGSPRPDRTEVEALRNDALMLLEPIQLAYDNPADIALPKQEVSAELSEIASRVRKAQEQYRTATAQILSLVSRAKTEGRSGDVPLKDAVAALEHAQAQEQIRLIEEQVKTARDQATTRVAQAKAELIEAESKAKEAGIQLQAQELRASVEEEKKQQEAAMEEQKRLAERKRLEALAMDPNVQSHFRCFFDKGYIGYNVHPQGSLQKGRRALPASFGDLNTHGWLANVQTFAQAMAGQGNTDLYQNVTDRTHYPFPTSDADWKKMEQLYELFKQVGPIWAEKGLLAP